LARITEFKQIESTFFLPPEPFPSLQQWRFPPSQLANSPQEALSRMFMLPGARYTDPEFSWRWATLPVGLEFIEDELGDNFEGDIFANLVGPPTGPGYLIRLPVNENSGRLAFAEAGLQDRVADNNAKFDLTESQALIIGEGYGIATDLKMSPSGTLYVVSHSKGTIYEIFRSDADGEEDEREGPGGKPLHAILTGTAERPGPGDSDGFGRVTLRLNQGQQTICYTLEVQNIATATAAHIHVGDKDTAGPVVVPLNAPAIGSSSGCASVDKNLVKAIRQNPENYYVNVHNVAFPAGAIRGQLE
jgi:hypothetical protein